MKVTAERKPLAEALAWVAQVCPRNPNPPALSGVRMIAGFDGLQVSAFDYESYHSATVPAIVHDDGAVLVPGHVIRDIVTGGTTDDVELSDDGTRLLVRMGKARYQVAMLNLDDAPRAPQLPPVVGSIQADVLAYALDSVRHTINAGAENHVLQAVDLRAEDGELTATGTDRYRAARITIGWDGQDFAVLPVVGHVLRALKGMTGEVEIHAGAGAFALLTDSRTVSARPLGGQYPDIGRFLRPLDEDEHVIECDGKDLAAALKRLRSVAASDTPTIKIKADGDGLTLTLAGEHEGVEYVDATVSKPLDAHANPIYLADAMPDGPVRIGAVSPSKPFTIHDPARDNLAQVVMPIRGS